jgi:hypothetical protein
MTIATAQQIKLITDFLTHRDGSGRPDIIVTTGMRYGEVVGQGCWGIQQELNDGRLETIIRMMAHTGSAVEVPPGEMADHDTQSTPHIHLGDRMQAASFVNVITSDEGNIEVHFFNTEGHPSFVAFKLKGKNQDGSAWQDKRVKLGERAASINEISRQGSGPLLRAQTDFFAELFEGQETVLFTGVPHRIATMTSPRVRASWALVTERMFSGSWVSEQYFIRLRGEYDPAAQNADGQMQGGLRDHQTYHSQHAHVVWESLARPVLAVGGPNGKEAILTFNGKGQRGKDGRFAANPELRLFNKVGMSPADIAELLQKHRGYLRDGRE